MAAAGAGHRRCRSDLGPDTAHAAAFTPAELAAVDMSPAGLRMLSLGSSASHFLQSLKLNDAAQLQDADAAALDQLAAPQPDGKGRTKRGAAAAAAAAGAQDTGKGVSAGSKRSHGSANGRGGKGSDAALDAQRYGFTPALPAVEEAEDGGGSYGGFHTSDLDDDYDSDAPGIRRSGSGGRAGSGSRASRRGGYNGRTETELMLLDPKRVKRILANRQSAARSKERRNNYTLLLEGRLQTLATESDKLGAQLHQLQASERLLLVAQADLEQQVTSAQHQLSQTVTDNQALMSELFALQSALGLPQLLPQDVLPPGTPAAQQQEQQLQAQAAAQHSSPGASSHPISPRQPPLQQGFACQQISFMQATSSYSSYSLSVQQCYSPHAAGLDPAAAAAMPVTLPAPLSGGPSSVGRAAVAGASVPPLHPGHSRSPVAQQPAHLGLSAPLSCSAPASTGLLQRLPSPQACSTDAPRGPAAGAGSTAAAAAAAAAASGLLDPLAGCNGDATMLTAEDEELLATFLTEGEATPGAAPAPPAVQLAVQPGGPSVAGLTSTAPGLPSAGASGSAFLAHQAQQQQQQQPGGGAAASGPCSGGMSGGHAALLGAAAAALQQGAASRAGSGGDVAWPPGAAGGPGVALAAGSYPGYSSPGVPPAAAAAGAGGQQGHSFSRGSPAFSDPPAGGEPWPDDVSSGSAGGALTPSAAHGVPPPPAGTPVRPGLAHNSSWHHQLHALHVPPAGGSEGALSGWGQHLPSPVTPSSASGPSSAGRGAASLTGAPLSGRPPLRPPASPRELQQQVQQQVVVQQQRAMQHQQLLQGGVSAGAVQPPPGTTAGGLLTPDQVRFCMGANPSARHRFSAHSRSASAGSITGLAWAEMVHVQAQLPGGSSGGLLAGAPGYAAAGAAAVAVAAAAAGPISQLASGGCLPDPAAAPRPAGHRRSHSHAEGLVQQQLHVQQPQQFQAQQLGVHPAALGPGGGLLPGL